MLKLWKPIEKLAWWRTPSEEEGPKTLAWTWPQIEMKEGEGATTVRIHGMGMSPQDVEAKVENDALVVRGRHEENEEEEGRTYHRVETFFRRIPLAVHVDPEGVEIHRAEGVLTVTLPHTSEEEAA